MSALPRAAVEGDALVARYRAVRDRTVALAAPLSEADCQVQSMPDASPVKWHLAHVTWFFETFVLERHEPGFRPHHPAYRVLYNSYYQQIGEPFPRPRRGLVSRPSLAEVLAWRAAVDERIAALLARAGGPGVAALVELGLQHEQQHQELLLTDVKHMLSCNPLDPVYRPQWPLAAVVAEVPRWVGFAGGLVEIGHDGRGFAFDNEGPRHRQFLRPYALMSQPVRHGDWLAFVAEGGYRDPRWWLAAGWDWVRAQAVEAPLYWQRDGAGGWTTFTLHGRVPIDPRTPVVHVSGYEADAYARWAAAAQPGCAGARLPTEAEWEHAAAPRQAQGLAAGNFAEAMALHPMPLASLGEGLHQLYGDCWEWTASAYQAYPGYSPWDGAAGEYNGKFMIDQLVLRGGSCASPREHLRATYRNFFPAAARWQFSGLRLALDH